MTESEQARDSSHTAAALKLSGEAALFAHVIWKTRSGAPFLAQEDVASAAYVAISARARNYRCRVLAVGGTADHIHVMFRFVASVPLSVLVRQAMEASAVAVSQVLTLVHEHKAAPSAIWQASYGIRTVGELQLDHLLAYVRQQQERHRQGETCAALEHVSSHREPRIPPPWSETIRESKPSAYHTHLAD